MGTNIGNFYWGSLLSQAAYGDYSAVSFDDNGYGIDDEVRKALVETGVGEPEYTDEQVNIFQDRFELIRPFEDPGTGFRAALFLDKTTNEYTLAFAGTDAYEFLGDVAFADLVGIAATG